MEKCMQKKTKLLWLILYFIGMIAVFALSESTIDFSSDDFGGFIFLTESCYTVTFLTVLFVKELSYPSVQKVNSNIFMLYGESNLHQGEKPYRKVIANLLTNDLTNVLPMQKVAMEDTSSEFRDSIKKYLNK